MTDYVNFNPRQSAMDEARQLLTAAARAAIAKGLLPEAELPDFIVEVPGDNKNGDIASNLALAGARAFRAAPRKIAEAILLAFVVATPLILAVGVLQFYLLPSMNWIFAFSILMIGWLVGTLVSAVRYR